MPVKSYSHKRLVKIFAHLNVGVISLSILDANSSLKSKKLFPEGCYMFKYD